MAATQSIGGNLAQNQLYTSPYAGQAINAGTAPVMPQFNQVYNPQTMSLGNNEQQMLSGVNYNQQPLQQLQANAESTAPSQWAQLQSQMNKQQTGQAASQAAAQQAGQTAQAEGNLAGNGGLSSGGAERAQEMGQLGGIGAQQSIQNQGNQGQLQIGLQDAANKQQEQMALPGMETQAFEANLQPIQLQGQANAQDVAAQMENNQALNQFNMNAFNTQGAMYGANQTANAQQNAANASSGVFGGGGFLGLGSWLCTERNHQNKLVESEKKLLGRLLGYFRKNDREFTKWYLRHGDELVARVKEKNKNWEKEINTAFISSTLQLLSNFQIHEAFTYYRKHVYALCYEYWPRCPHLVISSHPERKEWFA